MIKIVATLLIIITTKATAMRSDMPENSQLKYEIRKGTVHDKENLQMLYKTVAAVPGGLARTADEITDVYINKIVFNALNTGIIFVADHQGNIIGSILKYALEPKVFSHVLGEGSILVHPDFQGKGIGTNLISTFLSYIENNRPDIYRIELIARESNQAIKLYEKLGFKKEGRFEGRIKGVSGKLEADIPMAWFNKNFKS